MSSRLFRLLAAAAFVLFAPPSTAAPGAPLPPVPVNTGSWRWLQPSLGTADLNDVTFPSTGHGFAVGAGGTVVRSNDGGATWEVRPTPSGTGTLKAVGASGQLVVACGAAGTLVRSTDGGSTFAKVPWTQNRTAPDFVDVQVLDATDGVLVASDGTFLTTSDAFQSLQIVGQITAVSPRALWFTNPQKGWVVGGTASSGTVVETTDGGRTFAVVHTGQGGEYRAVTGISFGTVSVVLVGGATLPRATVLDESKPAQGWQDVELPGGAIDAVSIALGGPNDQPELWFAADDGLWDVRINSNLEHQLIQSTPALRSVAASTRGKAFAVGQGGSIYEALYGSPPAKIVEGGHAESFTAATFPTSDGQLGAFGTFDGTSAKLVGTTDGARTLVPLETAPSPVVSLSAVDAQHGFGLLQSGDLYSTNDGGLTWTRVSTLSNHPQVIAFSSATTGYAAGDGILQTTNGGTTWTAATSATQGRFTALAVGANGLVAAVSGQTIIAGTQGRWQVVTVGGGGPQCTFTTVAVLADGTIVGGGSNGTGGCAAQVQTQSDFPSSSSFPTAIVSLGAVGQRLFALFSDGHLAELTAPGLMEANVFASHASLKGLVARSVLDASGEAHPAPIAYGDFGSLVVFDDSSSPTPPPLQAPVVSVNPTSVSLPFGQVATITATASDPQGLPLTYTWSDPNDAGLAFGSPNAASTALKWSRQPPSGTVAVARVTVCDTGGACSTADVKVDSGASTTGDEPPVAVAPGVAVPTGTPILLDATGSHDPDGDPIASYEWKQLSGPPVVVDGRSDQPILMADAPPTPANLVFELEVCDPGGLCARLEVTVVVYAPNTDSPPVAATKGDLEVQPGALATLDATDSYDPEDGSSVTFAWRELAGPPVTLSTPADAVASFVAGPDGTTYRFAVRVCDRENACSEAAMNVVVEAGGVSTNLPPLVKPRDPAMSAKVGDRVTLSAVAEDPENEPVTVKWTDDQPGLGLGLAPSGPTDATFVVPPGAAGKTLRFTVSACDPEGACSTADATVTVVLPSVVADAGPDQIVAASQVVTLDGSASTGQVATWAWTETAGPAVHLTGADGPRATFTAPPTQSTLRFTLNITGVDGATASDDVAVTVTGPLPPIADAGKDQTVGWGARVQLDGRSSKDPLGRALSFSWKGPDGLALAGADSPLASFFAPAADVHLAFTLTVCAGDACADSTVAIVVQRDANLPPLPDAGPDRRAMGGSTIVLDGTRSLDPEGERLTAAWSQLAGPAATVSAADSLWTQVQLPDVAAETTLAFALDVCDPEGACATGVVHVDVLPSAGAPTVVASIDGHPDGAVDEQADFTVALATTCPSAPCADGGKLAPVSGPPLARVGSTGWKFHAPSVSRDLPFELEASVCDTAGRCGVATLDGLVTDSVDDAPVAVVGADQAAARRQVVTLDASSSFDPNGDAMTFAWTETSGAPMTLAPDGSPRVRFTVPDDAAPGPLAFQVKVCDDRGACSTATTTVTVTAGAPFNRPPFADAGGDRRGPAGVPLVLDAHRSFDPDGDAISYAWSISAGPGATLDTTDEATTKLVVPGLTPADAPVVVRLQVCDAAGACATDEVHVTTFAPAVDTTEGDSTIGEATQACGCAGDPGSMLALLGGALVLFRRRRRR